MAIAHCFVAVDPFLESERFHLLCVLRVRHENETAPRLRRPAEPLAFEFSCVPRDRKMNFLRPGLKNPGPKNRWPAILSCGESDARARESIKENSTLPGVSDAGWSSRRSAVSPPRAFADTR